MANDFKTCSEWAIEKADLVEEAAELERKVLNDTEWQAVMSSDDLGKVKNELVETL